MTGRTTLTADDGRTWDVPNDRLNRWHTVWLRKYEYKVAHPIDCDLTACECDRMLQSADGPPAPPGTYKWTAEMGLWQDEAEA